jgi:hypothetical protein
MANTIKPKRSNTASKVPNTSELVSGELGVNMADKKIYINNGTSVVQVGAGLLSALGDVVITTPSSGQSLSYNGTNWVNGSGSSGDVTGAASSTDNAITRFDGTTGKIIQNSTVTLDDTGNIVGANSVQFGLTPTVPTVTGTMYWDEGNGTPSINIDADVTLQLGQEMLALVYNGTGSTITNGSVVAVSGAQGQRPRVSLADADSEALSAPTLGIATEDIANGAEGFVTTFGFVRGINTSAFTAGAPIYLSQTAGQFTATRPSAPAHTVALGWVIKVNASSGEVFVNINNGWELDELHNVLITSAASGNTLIYDAVAGVWKNANITAGTGISVTNGAGSITIAATNAGTVTSVTATSPVASTGGATPVISMPAATTSVSGYLTSTDWNTFNGKQAALVSGTNIKTVNGTTLLGSGNLAVGTVTGVTATSPVASSGGTAPVISMPAATTSVSGYLTSTDWNTFNGKGNGTVTSVGITAGTGITVTGSPITSSGNITISVASIVSSMIYDSFTATASQTTFTTSQSYTSGKISVFKNGAKMRNGSDVTVTSGSSVVFAVACTLNDVIDIDYPTVSTSGNFIYDTFTATASQTTFTSSASYTANKIDVYVNGAKVRNGSDVTVSGGTSVVFATGLAVGSLVDLVYPI